MKKISFLLCLVMLSTLFSAVAFGAEETKIEVWIDEEKVEFEEEPFSDNGTTLVPFRVLFSELGLNVKWDQATKTVTGINDTITVELTLESNEAIINGETIELLVAPQLVNNHTFVPLRFVGEATGASVQWDGATKTISITSPEPEVNDEELILELFDRYVAATNDRDLDGFLEVFNEQYEMHRDIDLEEISSHFFEEYDIETTMEELEIIEIDNDEAIVFAIEVYERVNGDFYIDNKQEIIYTLHKNKDGLWQISEDEILVYEKINLDKLKEINAEISSKDEKKILDTLEKYFRALEDGDAALLASTFHEDSIVLEEDGVFEESMEFLFEIAEFEDIDLEHASVVSISDEEYAKLYVIRDIEISYYDYENDDTISESVEGLHEIFHFKKSKNGNWKLMELESLFDESNILE
ncbi:stalk domain-containing protein [Chengkuizengella axinellae]|uniref:Stalk domain-containing protein n=1 Tax=Chengkuizengella axinellae TaxID=3064388 RepID=A0ABT9IUF8_9BACL|nr:stalk domain-containing protein [Chengkuizengella sp. 2205SS18-9]MDP5272717.1 stalk domain-containing protein [Chengkuizengella sp. 2205SS18-9]